MIELCRLAQDGKLTIEQLNQSWPDEPATAAYLPAIREDLEDGVTHFPKRLFAREPDWESWYQSDMYNVLVLDEVLLDTSLSDQEVADNRARLYDVVRSLGLTPERLREWIKLNITASGLA